MNPKKPDFDGLEKLGNRIYDRDFSDTPNFPKPTLPTTANTSPRRWKDTEELFADEAQGHGHGFSLKALFLGSLIFFLVCASIAGVIIYRGFNTVSNNNVAVSFVGPVTIAAGTPLDFSVVIKNNNIASMENARLYLTFPNGTVEATNTSATLLHESDVLGTIASGTSMTHNVEAVIYGAEHATEQITATIQYSIANDNALYQKKEIYTVEISSAPLAMNINAPSQTPAGAPVNFSLTLSANSNNPPSNVLVTAQYPFGFQFASSTPAPSYSNNSEWLFPALSASSTETITIRGYLQGQENDQETVRFLVGTQSQVDPQKLGVIYLAQNQTLTIQRSPVALAMSVGTANGNNVVIQPGSSNATLTITNNLPVDLLNAVTTVTLNGNALDPTSVNPAENGIYRQSSQAITWDRLSDPDLGVISPGQQISLQFSFATLPASVLAGLDNGTITLSANVSGQEYGAVSGAAPISSTSTLSARLTTAVGLLAHAVYSTGPFTNTGLVPPRADTPTTYTIVWTLTNSSNTVSGGTVTATLPAYVKWLNNISPSNASVTFDTNSNTITWTPGTLPAGGAAPVASVAFQVEVDPTVNQVGTAPDIVNDISFNGTDAFVNVPVSASAGSLTTDISSDPTYGGQNGFVQQ